VPSNTGGKTHSISSGFLNEATNAIWSGFFVSQFAALPFEENKSTVTTDANGSFTDIVFGNATTTSKKVSPEEATQIVQKQIESRVKVVTEQTLTIAGPNKEILATAVYQRTITNLDEQGNRRPAFDSSGRRHVNNFSITVGSVTVSRPSSP
jgi:hypothetical protein